MNWVEFLTDNNVPYVTRGPNTKRGEVSIKCPYCGVDDPSEHLGISLTSENWGCHRNGSHRGKAPHNLVQALLGCSWSQAKLIVRQYSLVDPATLDDALAALNAMGEPASPAVAAPIEAPTLSKITKTGSTARFWHYLRKRGYDDVDDLVKQYRLKCCLTGRFKDRIIIPFYQNGKLIAWTGRAIIDPKEAPRYLSSSGDLIKTTVFNEDQLLDGDKVLVIAEGPFDALKLDYYGYPYGVRATCVFGTSMSMDQIYILTSLRKRFKRVVILFDLDAVEPVFAASDWLHAPNVKVARLPDGEKDPGGMSRDDVEKLISTF